jgi:hypothetical protein
MGDVEQIYCRRGSDLNKTITILNGSIDRACEMIDTSMFERRSLAPVESPNTKRQRAHIANITLLPGLITVRGMLVTQGMCPTAVDAQIQDLIAEQAII